MQCAMERASLNDDDDDDDDYDDFAFEIYKLYVKNYV